jgi:hypothetical protein
MKASSVRLLVALLLALGAVLAVRAHRYARIKDAYDVAPTRQKFVVLRATHSLHPTSVPTIHFRDVAAEARIQYRWTISGNRPVNIRQVIGNGCAFLDYDQDGNLDILLIGPRLALYRGDGRGHFTDVTHETGLDRYQGEFLGCAVGDYDNDGYPDLYISAYRGGILLHNEPAGDGSGKQSQGSRSRMFRDVTQEAGLASQPWGSSCAFAETRPGSGQLDLYVANYVDFGPDTDPQLCDEHGVITSCGPQLYKPLHGVFYINQGQGRFTDRTAESGLNATTGKGLGVLFADLFGDHRPALYIANDEMPGDLLQSISQLPLSKTMYKNVAVPAGVAFDRDGNTHGGMGVDGGDYNNDGRLDLLVTTFQNESRSLYRNQGNGLFFDSGMMSGFGAETSNYVAFGCKFLDFDNDGNLDVIIANGHIKDNVQDIHPQSQFHEPTQLFHNMGGANPGFSNVSASSPDLMRPILGRGLAIGDFDNDGRMDILVVDSDGAPLLLHNECSAAGHWLGVRLIGSRSNRDGYGAMLTARCGKRTLLRYCHADGSYLSSSDPRVHFGLGSATQVDRLTIRWPSGQAQVIKNPAIDRYMTVQEPTLISRATLPILQREIQDR